MQERSVEDEISKFRRNYSELRVTVHVSIACYTNQNLLMSRDWSLNNRHQIFPFCMFYLPRASHVHTPGFLSSPFPHFAFSILYAGH